MAESTDIELEGSEDLLNRKDISALAGNIKAESPDIDLEGILDEDLLNRFDFEPDIFSDISAGNIRAESPDIDLERLDEDWRNRREDSLDRIAAHLFSDISAGNIKAECTDTDLYSIVDSNNRFLADISSDISAGKIKAECTHMDSDSFVDWVNRLEAGNIKAEFTLDSFVDWVNRLEAGNIKAEFTLDSFVDWVNRLEADISSDISAGNIFTPVVARKRDIIKNQYRSLNQQAEISSIGALLNEPVNNDAAHARVGTRQGQLQPAKLTAANIYRDNAPSVVIISNNCWKDVFSFEERGYGTGFFWDDKGHIVTNYHVIQCADILSVTLRDQSVYPAEVIGQDPDKDVAVLCINAPKEKLRPVTVGSSRGLVVGQKVCAIGNPFRLSWTCTTGRIGFLDRLITSATGHPIQVIQTDAYINRGSSGGPLFDSSGFLIGINTSMYSPSGTSAGVSFSIPVDTVSGIIDRWVNMYYGKIRSPILGISSAPDQSVEQQGVTGVLVLDAAPDGPAGKAARCVS